MLLLVVQNSSKYFKEPYLEVYHLSTCIKSKLIGSSFWKPMMTLWHLAVSWVITHREGNYSTFLIYLNNIVLDTPMVTAQPIFMSKVSGERYWQALSEKWQKVLIS